MSFKDRSNHHDSIGIPAVRADWGRYSFITCRAGNEMDDPAVRTFLYGQNDRLSLMLRYRPDTIMGLPPSKTILVEVKTTQRPGSWAIEFDAWRALSYWNQYSPSAIVAFVCTDGAPKGYCFSTAIQPRSVKVPMRSGSAEWLSRVASEFPKIRFSTEERMFGSGTPYFVFRDVGPDATAKPLDQFIGQVIPNPAAMGICA